MIITSEVIEGFAQFFVLLDGSMQLAFNSFLLFEYDFSLSVRYISEISDFHQRHIFSEPLSSLVDFWVSSDGRKANL